LIDGLAIRDIAIGMRLPVEIVRIAFGGFCAKDDRVGEDGPSSSPARLTEGTE
jgi:hypothetical protein